jgi:hypothetical protein
MMKIQVTNKDIKDMKQILEKIEGIIDSRLIGIEEPENDEVQAIDDYEKNKKSGNIKLIALDDA